MGRVSTTVVNPVKYGKLLVKVLPRPITSEKEYDQAMKLAGQLMEKGEGKVSPEEGKLLELLGILIEDYDDKRYPAGDHDPVTVLNELMTFRSLTAKDLWPVFGSRGATSDVLNGRRAVSKSQAKRLAQFFHVTADLFI
jgi:HTH-type transcriptional regulator / antitoxin HigA